MNAKAAIWHVAPEGDKTTCSICGVKLWRVCNSQHRAVDDGFEKRQKTRLGWKVSKLDRPEDRESKHQTAYPKTLHLIDRATALLATGTAATLPEAARILGVKFDTLRCFRNRHRLLWNARLAAAQQQAAETGKVVIEKPLPDALPDHVEKGIRQATAMFAAGSTHREVSDALGVPEKLLCEWSRQHESRWNAEHDRAAQAAVVIVRKQVGTDAVLDDPKTFLRQAMTCEKWCAERGESLLPVTAAMTLTRFYSEHYKPQCLFDAKPETCMVYEASLCRWKYFTGDPPLNKITSQTVATFRDCLGKLRGKSPSDLEASPNTVRSKMRCIQTLLDKTGPPGRRNRDALGLIQVVPWARAPKYKHTPRTTVTEQQLSDVYLAAVCMDLPRIDGFKPSKWWRALLVTAYYTAFRRGTLFSLRMKDIDWDNRMIVVPGERMKAGRVHAVPLVDAVVDHLLAIRTDRQLVFPWPHCMRHFHTCFHRLQTAAGILRKDHFGLHALRRTAATALFEHNPGAARLLLGHQSDIITQEHYVGRQSEIVRRGMDAMPQPAAFVGGDAA